jgi:hypothetical protein
MRRSLSFVLAVVVLMNSFGCDSGPKLLPLRGKLLKNGEQFEAGPDELIQITFVPIRNDGKPVTDHYYANVDDVKGTFVAAGKTGRGMPAGKYRVALELMKKKKDVYKGKFDQVNSPFVFDITASTKEIVIDVEKPPTG